MMNLTPRANRVENNIAINGGIELNQRFGSLGSTTHANNTNGYSVDRIRVHNNASGITISSAQISASPTTQLQNAFSVSKTAAGSVASGTQVRFDYRVEGYDLMNLMLKEWSVIFLVRSSVAATRSLAIVNGSSSHSYVQQYSIDQANTWELKVVKMPALSSCPGTLDRTNGLGIQISWNIVAGSDRQTASVNQWVAGNFQSGIGEDTTWLTGTTHNFDVTGIMILPGDWTGLTLAQYQFVRAGRTFSEELGKAQRYYEFGSQSLYFSSGSTGYAGDTVNYKNSKRATPTLTIKDGAGNTGFISRVANSSGGQTASQNYLEHQNNSESHRLLYTAGATCFGIVYSWTADAEL